MKYVCTEKKCINTLFLGAKNDEIRNIKYKIPTQTH